MTFFWFRRDLRLHDNAGLYHALKSYPEVVPVFIFDSTILERLDNPHDRRVHFIYQVIENLKCKLRGLGSDLWTFYGRPVDIWKKLVETYSTEAVYANHDYEPYARERDNEIFSLLKEKGIPFYTFKDQCIFEKDEILKEDGLPYTVYTPYSRKWKAKLHPFYYKSYPTEKYFSSLKKTDCPAALPSIQAMGFQPTDVLFTRPELPSSGKLIEYKNYRDYPARNGTTRLSVHLRFGTISIRELVRHAIQIHAESFLNELIWRDFYMMILWHYPQVEEKSFKPEYDKVPWNRDEEMFDRWKYGNTGIPLVDAGMRELAQTGYMHNRVRMVVASFLTKNLLIDWRWGQAWFARHLMDFDLSANNGGWQWSASTGCDAAPYFRVFNPILQQKKFDPDMEYILRWVPEYGTPSYPEPMVDLDKSRRRAVEIFSSVQKNSG